MTRIDVAQCIGTRFGVPADADSVSVDRDGCRAYWQKQSLSSSAPVDKAHSEGSGATRNIERMDINRKNSITSTAQRRSDIGLNWAG